MAVPFGKWEAREERTTVALTAPRPNGNGRREETVGPARRWLRRIFPDASPARRVRMTVKRAVEEGRLLPAWLLVAPPSAMLGRPFSAPAAYQRVFSGPARRVRVTSEGVESQTSDSISSTRNVARGISTSLQPSVGRPKNARQRTVTATSMTAAHSTRSAERPTPGARLTSHGATMNATTAAAAAAAPSKDRVARNVRKRENVVAKKGSRRSVQSGDDIEDHGLVPSQPTVPHSPAPLQPHLSATMPFIRERSDREIAGNVTDHGLVASQPIVRLALAPLKSHSSRTSERADRDATRSVIDHGLVSSQPTVPHSPAPLQPHLSATMPFIRERSDREIAGNVTDHGLVASQPIVRLALAPLKSHSSRTSERADRDATRSVIDHGLVSSQPTVPHSPAPLLPHLSATMPFIRERSDREATASAADHGQVSGDFMMPPSPKIPKIRTFSVEGVVYTTCRFLGRGGSAKVYEVVAPDGQHFALKRSVHRDPDIRHRMWSEVIKLAGITSPHVIHLVGAQLTPDAILVVLELGEFNLETWLSQLPESLDDAEIEHLWKQILLAVRAVHKAGYIHGDLKPSNFVFVGDVLKLIDFDIAAQIPSGNSHVVRESGLGTYDYISPEALDAQNGESVVKARGSTDVWSLGCVLYQMVLGEPPFAKFIGVKKLYEIANPDGIRIPVIANPAIRNVLEGCLQYDQAKRPTVEDLLKISFVLSD